MIRNSLGYTLAVGLSVLFWLAVDNPVGAWIAGAGTVTLLTFATAGEIGARRQERKDQRP